MDFIKKLTVTNEGKSSVKIAGEIPFEELQKHRTASIAKAGENVEIDGFRKGRVPEKIVVERVGEMAILSDMAERALSAVYPEVLKEHNIEAIGYPQIEITKIAQDNPLGFTATVATMPDISLPDYKDIAANENKDKASAEVTAEEIEKQVKDILRQKIAYERIQEKAKEKAEADTAKKDTTVDATELPTPETAEQETHTHEDGTVHEGPDHDEDPEITDAELPELTDEYVKTLGQPGQFESVDDFKEKIKEHLSIEKKREVAAGHRAKITDAIIEKTEMELPDVLIDAELQQMFAQMNEDLTRANLQMDDYLTHIKKTKEDLQKEWAPAAEKRAKLQLVLNEIAKEEKITPNKVEVDAQVDQLLEQHKDADEARVRVYVESVMTNEEVMKMLEEQK